MLPSGPWTTTRTATTIPTRWKDNDVYGHVNNVEYYAFFDTVINAWLIAEGGLDIHAGPRRSACAPSRTASSRRRSPSPRRSTPGCGSGTWAARSVRYEIGLFGAGRRGARRDGLVRARVRRPRDAPAGAIPDAAARAERLEVARVKVRGAVLREMGLPAPYAQSRPLEIVELELAPPGPGRAAGPRARRRPVPLRPVGDRRLAPARDADGAGPRGARARWSSSAATRRGFAAGDHVVAVLRPHLRRMPAVPRRAAPALCEPGAAANAAGTLLSGEQRWSDAGDELHHHLGVSAFADHVVVSHALGGQGRPGAAVRGRGAVRLRGADRRRRRGELRRRRSPGDASRCSAWAASAWPRCSARGWPGRGRSWPSTSCPTSSTLARELGATHTVLAGDDVVEAVSEATGGGADHAHRDRGQRDACWPTPTPPPAAAAPPSPSGSRTPTACSRSPPCRLVTEERTLKGSYLGSCVPPRHAALRRPAPGGPAAGRPPAHPPTLDRRAQRGLRPLAAGECVRQAVVFVLVGRADARRRVSPRGPLSGGRSRTRRASSPRARPSAR